MSNYSIKDLEQLTGIKAHTIRIWEKRYNIVIPKRTDTNIRYYCDDDLRRLLNISILNRHGYKISKLADMKDQDLNEKVQMISSNTNDFDGQIEALVSAMIKIDEHQFEKTLMNLVMDMGFEDTLIKVIYPFFQRIGVLWQTGAINPAQEHFVSNIIRQKLFVAIDGLISPNGSAKKKGILFLPEKELHEIGLLFYTYLLKKSNYQVIYLGQNVPFNDLKSTVEFHKPDFLFCSITTPMPDNNMRTFINKLGRSFPELTIFLNGTQIRSYVEDLPENVEVINTAHDFKERLSSY